ncbi:MAG: J domain-containing protein [Methylobacter sp.]
MNHLPTHYDNLKIPRNASDDEIRASYKHLMQKYHPDKYNGPSDEALRITKTINYSYKVLINGSKRAKYDQWIRDVENRVLARNGEIPAYLKDSVVFKRFSRQSRDNAFYSEKELLQIASQFLDSKPKKFGFSNKRSAVYFFGATLLINVALFFIGTAQHNAILTTISFIMLFLQPVYIMYLFVARLLNAAFEKH